MNNIIVYTDTYGGPVTLNVWASAFPVIPTASQCVNGVNVINLVTFYTNN